MKAEDFYPHSFFFPKIPNFALRLCVMRMNYSMIGCQKSVSFVTSQEMVVGLPHSEYRL